MNPLKIGGVPEHFNLPWQLALEKGLFDRAEIYLEWTFYAGGTGTMTSALKRGDLDMAILLTEGFVSAIDNGLEAAIVKTYIESPLVWGIYTGIDNPLVELQKQRDLRYAVSRFGSGSHLMAMIHADQRGIQIPEDQFDIVNSIHGGVDALEAMQSDVFYWEKFMTRPFVKSGQLRKIGKFHAPWSGFLIVASGQALEEKGELIKATLDLMMPECMEFKQNPKSARTLTKRFEMTEDEAQRWLDDTVWNDSYNVEWRSLENARNALAEIGFCKKDIDLHAYLAPWVNAI
jgi:sulfonate transport system substrate-binding protein